MNGTQVIQTELVSYRIDPRKVWFPAVVVGVGALVLAIVLGIVGGFSNFMHAYLAAYLFWFGVTCGCISLTMLHHLTGGRWGDILRPLLESGAKCLVLDVILFIPIVVGMKEIYPWTQPRELLAHAVRHQFDIWTYPSFFIIRAIIYFIILGLLVFGLLRKYRLRDEMAVQNPEYNSGPSFRYISGPGIVIFGLVISLAMFDWEMSTQSGYYSTIYGLIGIVSQGLSTVALMMIVLLVIVRQWEARNGDGNALGGHQGSLVGVGDWHDLGNLMFMFIMLWGYMSLSQMLITYSGHLPQETVFYNYRSINGWQYIGGFLIALHFCVPFLLLLNRKIKRDPKKLVWVALFILVVRQLDLYYQIHPSYTLGFRFAEDQEPLYRVSGAIGWHTVLNVLTPIGLGGLWLAFFAWNLRDRRVLPAPPQEEHHG